MRTGTGLQAPYGEAAAADVSDDDKHDPSLKKGSVIKTSGGTPGGTATAAERWSRDGK